LLKPVSGKIYIDGIDTSEKKADLKSVRSKVGLVFQYPEHQLFEETVRRDIAFAPTNMGLSQQEIEDRVMQVSNLVGISDEILDKSPFELSGGQKRRVAIAGVLAMNPGVLVLDEPTVGVDPVSRRELWQIVYRLVQQEGMTVLLSTAYLDEAERCQDIILLHEGEVLGQGPPVRFRDQIAGHSYSVTAPGLKKRALQKALSSAPGVVDALIQGERIRLVMDTTEPPDPSRLLPQTKGLQIQPALPRLEDAFIALLRNRKSTHPHAATPGAQPTPEPEKISHPKTNGNSSGPVIKVENLQRRFGDFYAVKGVTFSVARGEVFGLLGANGAGKSTTFRMLCGLLPASEGHLEVAGMDLRHAAARARSRIGYMSQKFSLYGNLTVCENLEFFSSAYGLAGARQRERIAWALDQFELGELGDGTSINLPLGHKQRLAMACALMHEPEILFLDEPTSGVDPLARREFWSRINALAEQHVTVLVTTHFMEEAEYCDRLAIMADGEILALGSPEEVKAEQRTESLEDAFIALIERKTPSA
jgi:ABC-2 type transport system ATP-binding protein